MKKVICILIGAIKKFKLPNMKQIALNLLFEQPAAPVLPHGPNGKDLTQIRTMDGAKPNRHGVFHESDLQHIVFPDKRKGWLGVAQSAIHYTQLNNGNWIAGYEYHINSPFRGAVNGPSIYSAQYATKQQAIAICLDAIEQAVSNAPNRLEYYKWIAEARKQK